MPLKSPQKKKRGSVHLPITDNKDSDDDRPVSSQKKKTDEVDSDDDEPVAWKKRKKVIKGSPRAKPKQKETSPRRPVVKEEEFEFGDARRNFKAGQKFITPPSGDGTRAFYESLMEENPDSPIAIKWAVEYGLYGGNKHDKLLDRLTEIRDAGGYKPQAGGVRFKMMKKTLICKLDEYSTPKSADAVIKKKPPSSDEQDTTPKSSKTSATKATGADSTPIVKKKPSSSDDKDTAPIASKSPTTKTAGTHSTPIAKKKHCRRMTRILLQ
eukprot:GHVL01044442.1.p1 GENE.GHVL01044442.1~~GHVL01044442.1.p1  ORF type:complete len:268 (+),score=67.34 GHVL01044442.1:70-873(+)